MLSINQVCELLGICRTTLWSLRRSGQFPEGVQVGAQRRWRQGDIEAWIDTKAGDLS